MPTKLYALEPGGPKRVQIDWAGAFKQFTVSLDGAVLGSFEDAKAMKAGRSFPLDGGSVLKVRLGQWLIFPEISLTLDDVPLPGSPGDPELLLAGAANVVFLVSVLSLVFGLISVMFDVQFLDKLGVNGWSILVAFIYGGLGLQVRKRQTWALAVAVILYVLDGIFALAISAKSGGTPLVSGLFVRIFFVLMMVRGFGAIRALESASRSPGVRPPAPPRPPAPIFAIDGAKRKAMAQVPATSQMVGRHRQMEIKTRSATDAAASGLRFVAFKCEISPSGLRVTNARGGAWKVTFAEIHSILVRQLPPDPPWSSQVLFDAVPAGEGASKEPIRIFGTTVVNYGALPRGASTSRLDNLRNLGAYLMAQNPSLSVDPETMQFLQGPRAPARFATMVEFHAYDARFGES